MSTIKDDLTTAQVAEYLGVNPITAKRMMRKINGAYKFAIDGGKPKRNSPWRVSKAKLDEFITRAKYSVGSAKFEELEASWYQ